ncbi:MAG: flagellar biosynthetic protein FliO [Noviherbaspirillum sp.]
MDTASVLQVLVSLGLVLGLLALAAWALKRLGAARIAGAGVVKVVGGVAVGNRERIMVVEVADQWIVVGVAPGRVSALSAMPRQEGAAPDSAAAAAAPGGFPAWLKQSMDRRNGR